MSVSGRSGHEDSPSPERPYGALPAVFEPLEQRLLLDGVIHLTDAVGFAVPDGGTAGRSWSVAEGLPAAAVTNVEYWLELGEDGDLAFRCDDYRVVLSSDGSGQTVWANDGGATDGGLDDDLPDDADVFLAGRTTDAFNGEPVDQEWSFEVADTVLGGGGVVRALGIDIHYRLDDGYEDNDSFETAAAIEPGTVEGLRSHDRDVFKINLSKGDMLTTFIEEGLRHYIYSPDHLLRAASVSLGAGRAAKWVATQSGWHRIEVPEQATGCTRPRWPSRGAARTRRPGSRYGGAPSTTSARPNGSGNGWRGRASTIRPRRRARPITTG